MSRAPLSRGEGRSALREALRLSWPATLSLLLHSGYRVNDQFWVQDLGPPAQAALGVTSFMLILNFAFITVVYSGALARTARFSGAGDRSGLASVYRTTVRFGFLWTACVAIAGWLSTPLWVRALGATGETAELATIYLQRIYACLPFLAWKPLTDAVFIGLGNTLVPMLLSALSVGLNFILNPILIYGLGDWEGMGLAGAAWATGFSRATSGLLGAAILWRYYGLRPGWRRPMAWGEVRAMTRIGTPMAFSTAGYALVFIAVLKTSVEPFGETVQAGLGIAFNGVESISYCGLMGPAVAAASMVGRRLGAGDAPGARAAVRSCLGLSVAIAALFSAAFLLIPEALADLYTDDPAVLRAGAVYLFVVGWSQVVTAASAVLEQALVGAGRTFLMSVFNIAGNAVRIPLAWALARPFAWGPAGVWWALNVSNYLKLVAIVPLFFHEAAKDASASPSP